METTFEPIQSSSAHSFIYYGDREGWLITLSVTRDSDALERSNWDVITGPILAAHPEDAAIERMSHWAVGWVDNLLVRPGSPAEAAMAEWSRKLDSYPVADEDHYGMLEMNEEWCLRCDRGTREQHYEGLYGSCRKFRGESERDDIGYRWDARSARLGRP